jgi:hypothetical protein
MIAVIKLIASVLASTFKSRARLEAEILVLRHHLMFLRRRAPPRPRIRVVDRLIFLWLYRLQSSVVDAVSIVRPETVVRWHRLGFLTYWRWKSRSRGGRPPISSELRRLVREMRVANPLWGARAFTVSYSSSASRSRSRPSPNTWRGTVHHRARAGRPFSATMPLGSRRWICSWCRRSVSSCSTHS